MWSSPKIAPRLNSCQNRERDNKPRLSKVTREGKEEEDGI